MMREKKDTDLGLKLDHLMIAACDWQATRAVYERLGFTLSPLRRNAPMGGADGDDGGSQLIMLKGRDSDYLNYLELSTVVPEKASPLLNRLLLDRNGPAMLVNFTNRLDAVQQHWTASNIKSHRFDASFPQSGTLGGGQFSILIADPDDSPIQIDAVWSSNRDSYRVPEWENHANGALAWTDVYCLCPDESFSQTVAFFQQSHNALPHWTDKGRATFDMGQVSVHLMTNGQIPLDFVPFGIKAESKPIIAGFAIQVQSLERVEGLLQSNAVEYRREHASIVVGPAQADGSLIRFVEKPNA
ncbi:MAG: VOC family protein [Sphingorhabdus sp.]